MNNINSRFFYSKEASEYDKKRWLSGTGQYVDKTQKEIVASMLGDISGKKILEIGAGTGRFSLLLAEMGGEVTALDISQEMLDIVKGKAEKANLLNKIKVVQSDASEKIPFSSDTFDFCITINALSHIQNSDSLFGEVHRALKKNGVFLSNYPNLISIYFPFGAIVNLRKKSFQKNVFTKWYTLNEIKRLNKMNNFCMVSIVGHMHFPININNNIFLGLVKLFDKIFRGNILKYIAPIIFIKSIKR